MLTRLSAFPAAAVSLRSVRRTASSERKGSAIRDVLDSALYLYGFTAHPLWTSVNSPALIEAAKAGLGITILPDILVKDALNEGSLISLETEGLSLINQLLLVTHKDKYLTEPLAELIRIMVPDETLH